MIRTPNKKYFDTIDYMYVNFECMLLYSALSTEPFNRDTLQVNSPQPINHDDDDDDDDDGDDV